MIWVYVLLGVYLVLLVGVTLVSLYPIRIPIYLSPGGMGAPQEAVEFEAADGTKLRGWWVEAPEVQAVAIYSHGYMMNRCELTPLAVQLREHGVAGLLLDLRRHGRSGGKKSGLGYRERLDVAAAVAFARERYPGAKIVLIGSSMGSAASALATAEDPGLADALILDSCYSRLPVAVLGWWRFLGGKPLALLLSPTVVLSIPFAGFNPFRIDIARALSSTTVPVLLMHGDCDDLAPPSEAERNLEALGERGRVVWLANCSHSEGRWVHPQLYLSEVVGFLKQAGVIGQVAAVPAAFAARDE